MGKPPSVGPLPEDLIHVPYPRKAENGDKSDKIPKKTMFKKTLVLRLPEGKITSTEVFNFASSASEIKLLPGVTASSLRWLMVYCREHQVSYGHAKFSKTLMRKLTRRFRKKPAATGLAATGLVKKPQSSVEETPEEKERRRKRKESRRKMERKMLSCDPSKPHPKKRQLIFAINSGACVKGKKINFRKDWMRSICHQLMKIKVPCLM